jgi:hypothetical protein
METVQNYEVMCGKLIADQVFITDGYKYGPLNCVCYIQAYSTQNITRFMIYSARCT